jgi:hypothetical protein
VKVSTHDGTRWRRPVSQGIILNFTQETADGYAKGTVEGFTISAEFTIRSEAESILQFLGIREDAKLTVRGGIDRVTGDAWAIETREELGVLGPQRTDNYSLKCKPTQRMF